MTPEQREAMIRQRDDDRAAAYLEACLRNECESVEAMESYWRGVWAAKPDVGDEVWHGPDPDRRLFAVDGSIDTEQTWHEVIP